MGGNQNMRSTGSRSKKVARFVTVILVSVVIILSVWMSLTSLPVIMRRASLAGEPPIRIAATTATAVEATDDDIAEASNADDTGDEPDADASLPPVSWSLVMDDEQKANMQAMREDLLSGAATTDTWTFLAWPALPYPLTAADDIHLLLDAMYSDEPLLSVCTSGQALSVDMVCGWYHVSPSGSQAQDGIRQDMDAVTGELDALVSEIDTEVGRQEATTSFLATGAERPSHELIYATVAATKLGRRCSYSDGIDDTAHANDIYGALVEGESKCYGMSCAMKALLDREGIPSFVARGTVGEDNARHAVNYLWVDGGWHVIDMTVHKAESLPDQIGWSETVIPTPVGTGPIRVIVNNLDGLIEQVVVTRDDYEKAHRFVPDKEETELMAAYEELIGATAD